MQVGLNAITNSGGTLAGDIQFSIGNPLIIDRNLMPSITGFGAPANNSIGTEPETAIINYADHRSSLELSPKVAKEDPKSE